MKSEIRNPKSAIQRTGYRLPATGNLASIRNPQSAIRNAFTLIELMVVIAIIILVAATALPTLTGLFTSGQDSQAYNILAAQLAAARSLAITKGTYAGVHVQMSDNPDFHITSTLPKCYTAIVWDDPATASHYLDLAPGYSPQPMPGSMAFGQVSNINDDYIDSDEYDKDQLGDANSTDTADWLGTFSGFTTFTILFSPSGEVVTSVDGGYIYYGYGSGNDTDLMKEGSGNFDPTADATRLWRIPADQYGVTAVTLFDYKTLNSFNGSTAAGREQRADYLNEFGQFLALNLYTGRMFPRE